MNDNDTSDEAFYEHYHPIRDCEIRPLAVWREAVHRCEARLDIQAEQHMETLAKSMASNVRLIIEKKKLEEQMEERERKAFEAAAFAFAKAEMPVGYVGPSPTWLDEAYRAYREKEEA